MTANYEKLLVTLKETSDEFANYLTELNNLNNDARNKCEKLLTHLSSNKPEKSCSVCYSKPNTHAALPCGHCYCENCCNRALTRNKCFTCRQRIESVVRIYI